MIVGFRISAQAGNTLLVGSRVSGGSVTTTGMIVDGPQGIPTINEALAVILVVDVTHY
jgi:hypothetical protein